MVLKTDIEFSRAALLYYDNPACVDMKEFQEDMKRFNRLNKYLSTTTCWTPEICRRVQNSLIVIYNIFGDSAGELLDYKISSENIKKLRALQKTIGRINCECEYDEDFMEYFKCL